MRRFFFGILIPLLLLLLVGGGVWWFVRSRAVPPLPVASQEGARPSSGTDAVLPSIPPEGVLRENRHAPTAEDRAESQEEETEGVPLDLWEEGDPITMTIPGYLTEPEAAPTGAAIPTTPAAGGGGVAPTPAVSDNADTDRDGLTDGDETRLYRTSPVRPDTDNDGLSDGDEAKTWHTDPLNPDTDGDQYTDGSEAAAGYNPNGPGKL